MPSSQRTTFVDRVRRAAFLREAAQLTDGELLECYATHRDEAAFEALVRRHGPMVLGVCRRLLQNPHDAEDAFQATFLVLVRKAAAIAPREKVGSWLYGAACLAAKKARASAAKRRTRERQVKDMPEPASPADGIWHDLVPLLDQELGRLPDRFRLPIVLCDLEGKTRKEVARQLGWPEGTVAGRLAQGRALLAKRLRRHGLPLSGGVLAAVLSQNAALAGIPMLLVRSTVKAAALVAAGKTAAGGAVSAPVAAITEGVLKAMLLTRIKIVTAALLMLTFAGGSVGVLTHRALAAGETPAAARAGATRETPKGAARTSALTVKNPVAEAADPLKDLLKQWEKEIRAQLKEDDGAKKLAARYPLVVLHSRSLYAGGDYKFSAFSFISESNDQKVHGNDVQLQFDNGGQKRTFQWNMLGGQENLVVDLGKTDFEKDPEPARISIDDPGVMTSETRAVPGHVYLERIRDGRGNNFYVVFQVVAVDPASRYMAFLWRKLPGGRVARPARPVTRDAR